MHTLSNGFKTVFIRIFIKVFKYFLPTNQVTFYYFVQEIKNKNLIRNIPVKRKKNRKKTLIIKEIYVRRKMFELKKQREKIKNK